MALHGGGTQAHMQRKRSRRWPNILPHFFHLEKYIIFHRKRNLKISCRIKDGELMVSRWCAALERETGMGKRKKRRKSASASGVFHNGYNVMSPFPSRICSVTLECQCHTYAFQSGAELSTGSLIEPVV